MLLQRSDVAQKAPCKQGHSLHNLQTKLFEAWGQRHVLPYYRSMVLAYIDALPLDKAEERILQEIKDIKGKRSIYYQLQFQQRCQKKCISTLKQLFSHGDNQNINAESEQLSVICQCLSSLRNHILVFVQRLFGLINSL